MNSLVVVASEITLALYPILIKKVDTDLATQIVSRTLIFTVLAGFLGGKETLGKTWGSWSAATKSFLLGLVTLSHVGASYYAFQQLSAGVSMSLFYTYPFFNLLFGALLFGDKATLWQLLLLLVAFAGVVLVAPQVREGFQTKDANGSVSYDWKGLAAGLGAALTETIMYFAVKQVSQPSPSFSMLQLYPGALLAILGILVAKRQPIDLRASTWTPMVLFNALIGFVGYALRFYAIPKLPTVLFSVLSFIGVVAAFTWGYLFVREVPTWKSLLGAALITGAAGLSGLSA